MKSLSNYRKKIDIGYWNSDHNHDNSLKSGVKAMPYNYKNSPAKVQKHKSVTCNIVNFKNELSGALLSSDIIGLLLEDLEPYSRVGESEFHLFKHILVPE